MYSKENPDGDRNAKRHDFTGKLTPLLLPGLKCCFLNHCLHGFTVLGDAPRGGYTDFEIRIGASGLVPAGAAFFTWPHAFLAHYVYDIDEEKGVEKIKHYAF